MKFLIKKIRKLLHIQSILILSILFITLILLSSCVSNYDDPGLSSPCVGNEKSPCVRRPINQMLT